MHNGWICLHRAMLEWEWYDDINVCRLFTHCLLRANHSPKQWRGMDIDRGQFWTSLDTLSRETGLSVKQIRTCLSKLERTGEVTSKGQAKGRMVTVSNYDSYQDKGKIDGSVKASRWQGKGKQGATNNNNNNNNNVTRGADSCESPAPASKSKTLKKYLHECEKNEVDAIPTDSIVFTNADKLNLPHGYVLIAWEHFKSHWLENKPNARKTNWVSTFNNCLKDSGYSAYQRNQNGEWYLTTKGKNTKILNGIAA